MYISNDQRRPRTEGPLEVQVRCVEAFPTLVGVQTESAPIVPA